MAPVPFETRRTPKLCKLLWAITGAPNNSMSLKAGKKGAVPVVRRDELKDSQVRV